MLNSVFIDIVVSLYGYYNGVNKQKILVTELFSSALTSVLERLFQSNV